MNEKTEIEVVIVMDSNGDYAVGYDEDNAKERFEDEIGGSRSRRVVKLKVYMAPPEDQDVEIDIPDTAGTTEQIEVEAA